MPRLGSAVSVTVGYTGSCSVVLTASKASLANSSALTSSILEVPVSGSKVYLLVV